MWIAINSISLFRSPDTKSLFDHRVHAIKRAFPKAFPLWDDAERSQASQACGSKTFSFLLHFFVVGLK